MPIQHELPVPIAFSSEEQKQIQQEIVKCGVLIPCERELNEFVSSIFVMPKRMVNLE